MNLYGNHNKKHAKDFLIFQFQQIILKLDLPVKSI